MKKYLLILVLAAVLIAAGCAKAPVADKNDQPSPPTETADEPADEVTGASATDWSDSEEADTVEVLSGDVEILGKDGFSPAEALVSSGEEVVFLNKASRDVVITFQKDGTRLFTNSPLIKTGKTYTHVFSEAGSYTYWTVGYGVKGKVTVE